MRSAERNTRIYLPGAQLVSVMDIEEDVGVHRWTKERWKKDGRKMEGRKMEEGRVRVQGYPECEIRGTVPPGAMYFHSTLWCT